MESNTEVQRIINRFDLSPHPEGGWYREVFRSPHRVVAEDGRARAALTTIYYLLAAGKVSQWHRVASDEVWHFYQGDGLELLLSADGQTVESIVLGPENSGALPACTVPAGVWQAARPLGSYALVGCTVGPGFDFQDFSLLNDLTDQNLPSL